MGNHCYVTMGNHCYVTMGNHYFRHNGLKEFFKIFEVKLPEIRFFGLKLNISLKTNFKVIIFLINRVSFTTYQKFFYHCVFPLSILEAEKIHYT